MALRVVDDADELRYEGWLDDRLAGFIRYTRDGDVVTLVLTDVLPELEGQGVGAALVAGALDDIRARGLRLVALCPFVAAYLRRHPEQADLLAAEH